MNAAARAINQSTLFNARLWDIQLSKGFIFLMMLLFALLASALAVVYVTNMYRINLSQLQQLELQTHQLNVQRGQLLLEQTSLAAPSRVERIAATQLNMQLPSDKNIYFLQPQR